MCKEEKIIDENFIHKLICNMPENDKLKIAVQCNAYGISPQKAEEIIAKGLNDCLKYKNDIICNMKYWECEKE